MAPTLYKTTIVIWSDYYPTDHEIEDLARKATSGDMYCTKQETVQVDDVESDPDWESGNTFFEGFDGLHDLNDED
jgi:hypothetical protein